MACFPTTPARAKWGHGEAALLFLFVVGVALLFTYLPGGQNMEKPESQRYTVVCGLRC